MQHALDAARLLFVETPSQSDGRSRNSPGDDATVHTRGADWLNPGLAALEIRFFRWRLGISAARTPWASGQQLRSGGPVSMHRISLPGVRVSIARPPFPAPAHRPPGPPSALGQFIQFALGGPCFSLFLFCWPLLAALGRRHANLSCSSFTPETEEFGRSLRPQKPAKTVGVNHHPSDPSICHCVISALHSRLPVSHAACALFRFD